MSVNQIGIFSAICKELDKQGHKKVSPRKINSCIEAANIVVAAFERDDIPATEGMGLYAWLASDDCGMSSKFMASKIGGGPSCEYAFPHDSDDFGRCFRFLQAVPGSRERLPEMVTTGKEWAALVSVWPEVEELYSSSLFGECTRLVQKAVHGN